MIMRPLFNIKNCKFILLASIYCLSMHFTFAQTADAGKDRAVCNGNSTKLGGSTSNPDWCYSWLPGEGLDDPKSANPSASPTVTTTYTLTVTSKDFDGKKSDAVKVTVVDVKIKSIEFTSDHNLMCDGTTLLAEGSRFPNVEWEPSVPTNAPMTHTSSDTKKIEIKMTVEVKGFTSATAYTITGTSAETAYKFTHTGSMGAGMVTLSMKADNVIKKDIRLLDAEIEWKIKVDTTTCDMGKSGPHKIYTTIGTPVTDGPSTIPNEERMKAAHKYIIPSLALVPNSPICYPGLINEVNKKCGVYYLGRYLLGGGENGAWNLPNVSTSAGAALYDGNPVPGCDCISIATFIKFLSKLMGIPGTFGANTYMAIYRTPADLNRPNKAIIGSLSSPDIFPGDRGPNATPGLTASWTLALADVNCNGAPSGVKGDVGCTGGLNNFEAAVEYTYNGTTWYVPGGTTLIYKDPNHVVQIFQTLAWCDLFDHDGNPMTPDKYGVRKVDFTYTLPAVANPCP